MNSTSTSIPLIPHICDRLKASIPNFTDASCKEFLNLNVNNIVSTLPTPTQIPDKCIDYCDHSFRSVMNDYNHYYHGYITLIVSLYPLAKIRFLAIKQGALILIGNVSINDSLFQQHQLIDALTLFNYLLSITFRKLFN